MAISKARKNEILATYNEWIEKSEAVILVEYTGATMKNMDDIRTQLREIGGEFHVLKNTLARRAFAGNSMDFREEYLLNSTAVSFAFLSDSALASASAFILLISSSVSPEEASILISCVLFVALSVADTLIIPFASISKVTSI